MQVARPLVACWGELVWDIFDDESLPLNTRRVLGGSATAIAAHLAELGARARLVTAVGDDAEGSRALHDLTTRGVDVSGVLQHKTSPTASVRVRLQSGGEPEYTGQVWLQWQAIDFHASLSEAVSGADALIFSAFAQGTCLDLGPLERALEPGRPRWVGCDLNLRRETSSLHLAQIAALSDFVKLNHLECERARTTLAGAEPAAFLLGSGRTRLVCVTSGANGARLFIRGVEIPLTIASRPPNRLVDTVGAGDAFTAALTLALLADLPPREALARATSHAESQLSVRGALPARALDSDTLDPGLR